MMQKTNTLSVRSMTWCRTLCGLPEQSLTIFRLPFLRIFFLKVGIRFLLLSSVALNFYAKVHAQDLSVKPTKSTSVSEAGTGLSQNKEGSEVLELKQRVEELESQVRSLQIAIGTLQTLFKFHAPGQTPSSKPQSEEDLSPTSTTSLQDLEVQVRALTAKVERLSLMRTPQQKIETKTPYLERSETFETSTTKEVAHASFEEERTAEVERSRLLEEGSGEANSQFSPSSSSPPAATLSPPLSETSKVARTDPPGAGKDPRQEYDQAYVSLVQKNFVSAQAGFRNFIKSNPTHALVPNALFWLGEAHYGLGNYADAAEAFDLVLQGYGNSPKAPESLIKKGMSLAALGKKTEACAALGKLPTQYPSSSLNIQAQVLDERARMGCP